MSSSSTAPSSTSVTPSQSIETALSSKHMSLRSSRIAWTILSAVAMSPKPTNAATREWKVVAQGVRPEKSMRSSTRATRSFRPARAHILMTTL
uniref:Uncharacterized protein n=1 Tax=Zea mays TaxID=4577 RepID=C4J7R7_MAIZE|nr:unknown [Zea mays]